MSKLFPIALAPTVIVAFYIYIRDKYEKEPIRLLGTGLVYGLLITAPIVQTEHLITVLIPNGGVLLEAFFSAFIVASLVEEFFKYIVLFFLVWRNTNFNERFDGIVYSVFISLGFAGLENVMYVFNPTLGGMNTAISRAIFSVPGHALFGVAMGYYFALARFEPEHKFKWMSYAFLMPFFLHGAYDFILMSNMEYLMAVFIPYVVYMWVMGFRKMKSHLEKSPFKNVNDNPSLE